MSCIRLAASLLVVSSALAAQDAVWVVGRAPGPGIDFTTLSAAVAAAADGDTILVHSGTYPSFGVNARSLAITAEAGGDVSVSGGVFIVGLQPGQVVSLQGLKLNGDPFSAALNLSNNDGDVWLLDCELRGYDVVLPGFFESGTHAVWSSDCASVVASGCLLVGGSSVFGEAAWSSDTSNVHLYGSTVLGGAGQCEVFVTASCGLAGTALVLDSGFLSAQSSTITGGAAAPGEEVCLPVVGCSCTVVAQGGLALQLGLGLPEAHLYDVTLLAGGATPPCGQAAAHVTEILSGLLDTVNGAGLAVAFDTPKADPDIGTLQVDGNPGDQVLLFVGFTPAHKWLPAWNGPLLIAGSQIMMPLGLLPPSGTLAIPVQAPPLPAGIESIEVLLQAARLSAASPLLANPARVILLDASF